MTEKIAILGGGMSALAAAYEIVKRSSPGDFDITVYQLGWRLGGKLATGRNYKCHDRIEEHGIHVLFGSYENVFYTLRRALADLGEDDWQSLFEQRSKFTAMEKAGSWREWDLDFPPGRAPDSPDGPCYPGDALFGGREAAAVPEMVDDGIDWIIARIESHLERHGCIGRLIARRLASHVQHGRNAATHAELEAHMVKALKVLRCYHASHWWSLLPLKWIPWVADARDALRRLWIGTELIIVGAVGLRRAASEKQSFEDLDEQDLRAWLDANALVGGGISKTTRDSAVLRMIYELIFAYEDGDVNRPSLAAGTAMRAMLRLFLDYRGAFVWVMKRGSETVVTPLYKVLKQHGVKFEFFHRVDELVASGDHIERVRMSIQARTRDEYRPLYGDHSWPATPHYDQLEPGSGLESGDEFKPPLTGKNPEYDATCARPVGSKELVHNQEFDKLILALPPDELKLRANFADDRQWQAMLGGLHTTATVAVQLWLDRDTEQLGWKYARPATVGTYAQPLPDWIDLTPTISEEAWPAAGSPASVIYLVGTLPEPNAARDIRLETEEAGRIAMQWLGAHAPTVWPNAGRAGFDWQILHDATNRTGEARLKDQYYRMNLERAERYTLTLPGTTRVRLKADESRYQNLVLCGDWTDNGLNVGAVEAAVMSGRQAARAVLGADFPVYGESLAPDAPRRASRVERVAVTAK